MILHARAVKRDEREAVSAGISTSPPKLEKAIAGHTDYVTSVAFSSDGVKLASGSNDKTVRVWDVETGTCASKLTGHSSFVFAVAFSPDGKRVASGSNDKTVKLWEIGSGICLSTLSGHADIVKSVAFSPDGLLLASSSHDKTVKLWHVGKGICVSTLLGHSDWVYSVAFSSDCLKLASASCDKTVKIWDVGKGICVSTLLGHNADVTSVSFSAEGTLLASGSEDKTIKLWDVAKGNCLATLSGHNRAVFAVSFSRVGGLASAGGDNAIKLWDVSKRTCISTIQAHSDIVTSVAFSPDGVKLVSGSGDRTIKIWDVGNDNSGSPKVAAIPLASQAPDSESTNMGVTDAPGPIKVQLQQSQQHSSTASTSPQADVEKSEPQHSVDRLIESLTGKLQQLDDVGKEDAKSLNTAPVAPSENPTVIPKLNEEKLQERDRQRGLLLEDWNQILDSLAKVHAGGNPALQKRLSERVAELKPIMELQRKLVAQFPLPDGSAKEKSTLWPFQQARELIVNFKKRFLVPIIISKKKLRQRREDIQTSSTLGVAIDPKDLNELSLLELQVDELFAEFKPAYDELIPLLRSGFPELIGFIWEEVDRHCGMGKLRMDIILSDFTVSPLPSAPHVLRATTQEAAQKSKCLKPKYILKRFSSSEDFYREMEAMRVARSNGVHHPNVGEVEFAFEEGHEQSAAYYLAMPLYLCDAKTWFANQLDASNGAAVIRALLEMTEGLGCLHHNGVIHGDIKPDNVMFDVETTTGRPKWIDFNFSAVDPKTEAIVKFKTAALGVTAGFAPPEFLDGSTTIRTRESDIYSLGKTIAVLLGMPDPGLKEGDSKAKPLHGAGLQKAKRALGKHYDELYSLCQLMTHSNYGKRISLTQRTALYGNSVLDRLTEIYRTMPAVATSTREEE